MNKDKLKQRILGEPVDFTLYLEDLIKANRIEDEKALGISKFVIANGPERLTDKQWYVFLEEGILPYNYVEECERCAHEIPWSEMLGAVYINEDNLCGYCSHLESKDT